MGHTYCSSLYHCVFSTKDRRKLIASKLQPDLWAYMGGIAREHEMKALIIGGTDDHVNLLLSLPSTKPIAKAMQEIKSSSSKWMREQCRVKDFAWQEGYGAFSISQSLISVILQYIANQQEHHKKHDYQEEFLAILKKHQIEYDPRYVWG